MSRTPRYIINSAIESVYETHTQLHTIKTFYSLSLSTEQLKLLAEAEGKLLEAVRALGQMKNSGKESES